MSIIMNTKDHGIDAYFVKSEGIEPRGKIRKTKVKLDFDAVSQSERDLRDSKDRERMLRNAEECSGKEYFFDNLYIYETYREILRTAHDVYRRPQHSKLWEQNQLWNPECNSVQVENKSNRLWLNNFFLLKKIDLLQVKMIQNDVNLITVKSWYDSSIYLNDANTRHQKIEKTPCKQYDLISCSYCDIETKQVTEYRIELYSVTGNYFYYQYIWKSDFKKKRGDINVLPIMLERKQTEFEKYHGSRYDRYFGGEYTVSRELLKKTKYAFTGKTLGAFIQKSLDNDRLAEKLNKPLTALEVKLAKDDIDFLEKRSNENVGAYELGLGHREFNEYLELEDRFNVGEIENTNLD